jgi:hypothetical protein
MTFFMTKSILVLLHLTVAANVSCVYLNFASWQVTCIKLYKDAK